MPNEKACKQLISTGVGNDIFDFFTDLLPEAGFLTNKISEQLQINMETELLSPEEFAEYKKNYWMPDGLRAMVICFMGSKK